MGYVICVSQPGGDWENPDPPPPTTTPTFESIPPLAEMSDILALPTPSRIGWNETAEIAPFADGTRLDCSYYIQPPVLHNWETEEYTSSCEDVAASFNVEVEDLVTWNPSLADDCNLRDDRQYCVQIHDEKPSDTSEQCAEFDLAPPGYDCDKFLAVHGLDMSQFVAWNPIVGNACSDFKTGQ